jgi:hypothetical protein
MDELEYLAAFYGVCILEDERPQEWPNGELAGRIEAFGRSQRVRGVDRFHKILVVREFIMRTRPAAAMTARAGKI